MKRTIQKFHHCQVLGCNHMQEVSTIDSYNRLMSEHHAQHHPEEIFAAKRWAYAVADRGPHYTRGPRYAIAWGEFSRRTYGEGRFWSGSTDPLGDFAPLPKEGRLVPHHDIVEDKVFDTYQEAVDDFVEAQQARIDELRLQLTRAEKDLVSFLRNKPSAEWTRDDHAIFAQ